MKRIFYLLLLVNAGLGGYLYLLHERPDPDAQLIQMQMNADQIRVMAEPPKRPVPAAPSAACLEWRSFPAAELGRARAALRSLRLDGRLSEREVSVSANWWVHIPPQVTQAAMERKGKELRDLGVTQFFPISDAGKWRYSISLGLFRTEEAARAFLSQLRRKGVRSAVLGNRDQRVTQTAFVVREPTPEESGRLVELSSSYPGTEVRASECPG
jgi:SPOR domain